MFSSDHIPTVEIQHQSSIDGELFRVDVVAADEAEELAADANEFYQEHNIPRLARVDRR